MVEDGKFTWAAPFWQQPPHRWNSMMDAGVRAAFFASAHAANIMITQRRGLIVNIKHGAQRGTFGQQPLGIPRRKVLKGLLVMFGPDRNSGPVCEQIQNPIKTAQKTAQLIARSFDLDGSGVNGHEPPGEETAATYRKICADEAESTQLRTKFYWCRPENW